MYHRIIVLNSTSHTTVLTHLITRTTKTTIKLVSTHWLSRKGKLVLLSYLEVFLASLLKSFLVIRQTCKAEKQESPGRQAKRAGDALGLQWCIYICIHNVAWTSEMLLSAYSKNLTVRLIAFSSSESSRLYFDGKNLLVIISWKRLQSVIL